MHLWWQIALSDCPLVKIDGRILLAIDGIKHSKEAEETPGVKKLHQDSEKSSKALYICGHHLGMIGILAGWVENYFVFPFVQSRIKE